MHNLLLTRRDGKNVIQFGIIDGNNAFVAEADTLAGIKAKAGDMLVSYKGCPPIALNLFNDEDFD